MDNKNKLYWIQVSKEKRNITQHGSLYNVEWTYNVGKISTFATTLVTRV